MKSNEERMHFVARFAEMKLDHIRPGDWLNLQEDLLDFLGWFSRRRAELTLENVAAVQEELARVLHDIVGTPPRGVADSSPASLEEERVFERLPAKKTRIVRVGNDPVFTFDVKTVRNLTFDCSTPGDLRFSIKANMRDSFLFALGVTLSKVDTTRLRACPTCTRFFYAEHGRQQFCSPRCATKKRVRQFRGQEAGTGAR